ncbi:MAG: hypothetical protein ACKVP7_25935 [Hyphomicrobiaceae bacterium]
MSPAPGSFLWLISHDVALNWRRFAGMLGAVGNARPWLIVVAAVVVSHLLAWPVARWLEPVLAGALVQASGAGLLSSVVICLFSWMIAQSLFGAMRTLYDRGDLDLLMGSPLPGHRVFAAKAVAIVASTLGSIAVLVLPLANMGALLGRPTWLAVYPTLLALGLFATAIALLVAIGLFFMLGARRARLVMQLSAAAIGGGFVLAAQIVILLPASLQDRVLVWLAAATAQGSALSTILSLPVHAAMGDLASMAVLLIMGALLFALAIALLSQHFAAASLAAAGAASLEKKASRWRDGRFRTGPGASLRRKEWRLLLRDPGLFAQVSLQVIYTIPLVIVLLKSGSLPVGVAVAPSLVVILAQIAASLAWITVSGEDAPELIASAPVAPAAVDRAKLLAIAAPVLALATLPVLALALVSPVASLVGLIMAAGACVSTALLNLWHPMPGNRRGMLRRHSQSKLLALIEHIIAVLWAVATVLVLLGTLWFLAPVMLACGVLALSVPASGAKLRRAAMRLRSLKSSPVEAPTAGL